MRTPWTLSEQTPGSGEDPPMPMLTVEHATEETNINFENGNFCTHQDRSKIRNFPRVLHKGQGALRKP